MEHPATFVWCRHLLKVYANLLACTLLPLRPTMVPVLRPTVAYVRVGFATCVLQAIAPSSDPRVTKQRPEPRFG
jgi:hypothetical protein